MGNGAPTIKRLYLERFVIEFKDKAVDILLRCCQDHEIEKEILHALLEQPTSSSTITNANSTHVRSDAKTSPRLQRTGSFSSGHHRQTSQGYMRPNARPPSPEGSRSNHSKSLSGKDGIENILVLSPTDDDDIKKSVVAMKPANITHSVIGKHIFDEGRIPDSNIKETDEELLISIPQLRAPGFFVQVPVTLYAELTWKSMRSVRSASKATHSTVFYLVPQELLDIDVLFGNSDSGEGQGFDLKEDESFHLSNHPGRVQSNERVQSYVRSQQEQASGIPPTASVVRPERRGEVSRASHNVTADLEATAQSSEQPTTLDAVRISCKLGANTLGIRLDPDAHAGAFIDNVQKEFKRRRLTLVQANTGIWLKREREASDDDGHFVPLDEDDLEDNWTEMIRWLKMNKQDHSNVVYGVFQIDPD